MHLDGAHVQCMPMCGACLWKGLFRNAWKGLFRNAWKGLFRNAWKGLFRNAWKGLFRNAWKGLFRNAWEGSTQHLLWEGSTVFDGSLSTMDRYPLYRCCAACIMRCAACSLDCLHFVLEHSEQLAGMEAAMTLLPQERRALASLMQTKPGAAQAPSSTRALDAAQMPHGPMYADATRAHVRRCHTGPCTQP